MLLIDIATQVALGAMVQPAHVPRYFRIVLELLLVAFENCRVDHVKPYQGFEEADVEEAEVGTINTDEWLLGEQGLQIVQAIEELLAVDLIVLLCASETHLIHPQVYLLVEFGFEVLSATRTEVSLITRQLVEMCVENLDDLATVIVYDTLSMFVPEYWEHAHSRVAVTATY